jgi:hypothetical protein
MVEWAQFVQWAFYGLITIIAMYTARSIKKLVSSVELLNKNVAVIIEKTKWHEKIIDKHDREIDALKSRARSKRRM